MRRDAKAYAKTCEQCQLFSPIPRVPPKELHLMFCPWTFVMWGLDVIGPFPTARGQLRWIITVTDYFKKWIEAKPVAQFSAAVTVQFVFEHILVRFGIPRTLISDNGTNFEAREFKDFSSKYGTKNLYSSPAHPMGN